MSWVSLRIVIVLWRRQVSTRMPCSLDRPSIVWVLGYFVDGGGRRCEENKH